MTNKICPFLLHKECLVHYPLSGLRGLGKSHIKAKIHHTQFSRKCINQVSFKYRAVYSISYIGLIVLYCTMEYSVFGLCPMCSVTALDNGKSKSQAVTKTRV